MGKVTGSTPPLSVVIGVGLPGAGCWVVVAVYSSNCPRDEGNRTSIVYTPKPPRNTHFWKGCQARPTRGWKLLLSRWDSAPVGWMNAPRSPVSSSTAFGSKLVMKPFFVLNGLSLVYRTPMLAVRFGVIFQSSC